MIAPVGTPLFAWSVELGALYPTGMVVVVPMVVVLGMVGMLELLRQERSAVQTHSVRISKKWVHNDSQLAWTVNVEECARAPVLSPSLRPREVP